MEIIEKMIHKIAGFMEGKMHVRLSEKTVNIAIQFIKFGIVGLSNTVIGYITNIATILLLQQYGVWWDYYAGNVTSFIIGVAWSFYWNNRYVFHAEEGESFNLGLALLKSYISYAFTGIILNNILSYVWIEELGISKMVAPLINMIISVPVNFLLNKMWTFKR